MIYIFNGPPGAGKDEACIFFKEKGFKHLSFKYELFKQVFLYFNIDKEWFMNGYDNRETKEQPEERLQGMSRRQAMIHVSEDIIKPKYGKEFFGQQLASQLKQEEYYCVSDGGFSEELHPIINTIGAENILIVQLGRNGYDFSSDSRRYFDGELVEEYILENKSEFPEKYTIPHKFPIRMYRIHNNATLESFRTILEWIYEKETHGTPSRKE